MKTHRLALPPLLALAASLAACGGGAHGSAALPGGTSKTSAAGATLTLHIPAAAPASATKRGVRYVPPATDQMVVVVSDQYGTAQQPQEFDLSTNSSLCVLSLSGGRTCTAHVIAPIGSDAFSVTLNASLGAPPTETAVAAGTIPAATVVEGQANTLPALVLGGVVMHGFIFPLTRGYAFGTTSVQVVVTAQDATYNDIIGAYDPSGLAVSVTTLDGSTVTVANAAGTNTVPSGLFAPITSSSDTVTVNPTNMSTGNVVEVQLGDSFDGLTMVQPNAMPSDAPLPVTSGNGPPAGTPFASDWQGESLTWVSQNSIWRYSQAGPYPTTSLVCSSYTISGMPTALYVDSAVLGENENNSPATYFLASDHLYEVTSSYAGGCNVEAVDNGAFQYAGHIRNLRLVNATQFLAMNADNDPVITAQTAGLPSPSFRPYAYPQSVPNSHPDGLVPFINSNAVVFSDSAGGYLGVIELEIPGTFDFAMPLHTVSGLSTDVNGDIAYLDGTEAMVWHPDMAGSNGTPFAPYDVGTVGIGVATTLATAGNAAGAFEVWAIDANGLLTSYAVPYYPGSGASFFQGAVSSTALAAAGNAPTALGTIDTPDNDGVSEGQIVLGSASAIVTYPSVATVQAQAKHRAPRAHVPLRR
jgi:hypothetical protein